MSNKPIPAEPDWTWKPRQLEGGEISLPSAYALVIKKVDDYDMEHNQLQLKITIILRIKVTGIDVRRDLLLKHLKEDLRMRINESEVDVRDMGGSIREAKSKDHVEGTEPDMLAYTIRYDTVAETSHDQMGNYPFDTMTATLMLELSHFDVKDEEAGYKQTYRFDCYKPSDWISWKNDVNGIPEFGINYEKTTCTNIAEEKKIKKDGLQIPVRYYPGIVVKIPLPRFGLQPTLNYFVPALFVSFFVLAASNVSEWDSVMEVISLALLTYVQLYQQIRSQIANTRRVTSMERMLLVYMFYCILPLIDGLFNVLTESDEPAAEPVEASSTAEAESGLQKFLLRGSGSLILFFLINGIFATLIIYRNFSQYAMARDRNPNVKVKAKAERTSPDSSWGPPIHPRD